MLSGFISFFGILFGVAVSLVVGKRRLILRKNIDHLKTTILVPFRNENSRILPLLNSINQSAIKHKGTTLFSYFEFIFIDDHSTDKTSEVILSNLDVPFLLVKLKETSGKKFAIKRGVERASFERILTLDADVSFKVDYLYELSKVPCKSLTILPVKMYGSNGLTRLFAVEFWFLQGLTFGLAGLKHAQLCNGANLLFTKQTFQRSLSIRKDANVLSGDDLFLLRSVNELNLDVKAFYLDILSVYTPVPSSLKDLMSQRLRWISKAKDSASMSMGFVVILANVFLLICTSYVLKGDAYYGIPILIKISSELLIVNSPLKWSTVLLHQLYYPLYLFCIVVLLIVNPKNYWR